MFIDRDTVILFTGTRADVQAIRRDGLLAGGHSKEMQGENYRVCKHRTVERVLREFGLEVRDVPEWLYRGELEYEQDRAVHLHFENSFDNAAGYADMGGEVAYCVRHNVAEWVVSRFMTLLGHDSDMTVHSYDPSLAEQINAWAKEQNGPRRFVWAVKLSLDDPNLDKEDVARLLRMYDAVTSGKVDARVLEHPSEVRYYGDLGFDKILGVVEV